MSNDRRNPNPGSPEGIIIYRDFNAGFYGRRLSRVTPRLRTIYRRLVTGFRHSYQLYEKCDISNLPLHLVIDDIVTLTLRIEDLETHLSELSETKKWDEKLEELLIRIKEQRRKAIDNLANLCDMKFLNKLSGKRKSAMGSFRKRMIDGKLSQKLGMVEEVEKTLENEQIRAEE